MRKQQRRFLSQINRFMTAEPTWFDKLGRMTKIVGGIVIIAVLVGGGLYLANTIPFIEEIFANLLVEVIALGFLGLVGMLLNRLVNG